MMTHIDVPNKVVEPVALIVGASFRKGEERELEQHTLVNLPELPPADELPQCDTCGDHHDEGEIPRECGTGDGV